MAASSATFPQSPGIGARLARVPRWLYALIALLVVGALVAGIAVSRSQNVAQAVTQPVVRQTLMQTVTASGTVNAQNTVSVGTQVSGTIQELDVDFNSKVKRGQVLARLDPSTIQAQLDQARANVAQAQAQAAAAGSNANGASAGVEVASATSSAQQAAIAAAQADAQKAQGALTLAQQQLSRDQQLFSQGFLAQSQVDIDRSNVTQDQAAYAQAQAAVAQARAQAAAGAASVSQQSSSASGQASSAAAAQASIASMQAIVQQDELNLQHAVITSPVDGVVVNRAVSVGQTVAASLQTPTLFTIAQDLRKMEVDINVAEPDIGNVKKGDRVSFTVLAYPNQQFAGIVDSVRINPQTVNNVVTYQVVVYADNASGKLLPGMTANATIDVASAPNALVVPLQALHVRGSGSAGSSPWGQTGSTSGGSTAVAGSNAMLLVQRNGNVVPVRVHVDLTTSAQAAVTPLPGQMLAENDAAVISTGAPHQRQSAGSNGSPFTPQRAPNVRGVGGSRP